MLPHLIPEFPLGCIWILLTLPTVPSGKVIPSACTVATPPDPPLEAAEKEGNIKDSWSILFLRGIAYERQKNWNYFDGMSDNQIYEFLKSDMTWHKPTQSFSSSDNFFKVLWNNALKDELDKSQLKSNLNHMRQFKFDHNDIKAFGILGISVGLKWEKIQNKFKSLVKKFHPDMNSGNKKYEEKLKLITLAYTQLKNTYRDKIDT